MGSKILYDEVLPGVQWSDPENRIILAAGPLSGTRVITPAVHANHKAKDVLVVLASEQQHRQH